MAETPNYLQYEQWPPWAKTIHELTLKAEAEPGPVVVSDAIRPLYNEVKAAIAENRMPNRSAKDVLSEALALVDHPPR